MSAKRSSRRSSAAALAKELSIIRNEFAAYMRASGYQAFTVGWYQRSLLRIATWLAARGRTLSSIHSDDVHSILDDFVVRHNGCRTFSRHRPALHRWLAFQGVSRRPADSIHVVSLRWLEDFDRFLGAANGLSTHTRIYRRRYAKEFLIWRFGRRPVAWHQVTSQDIWRFAERFCGRVCSSSANVMLCSLRVFLRYVQLRGACDASLVKAVPKVANYGRPIRPLVISDQQVRQLTRAFRKNDRAANRDCAMVLCMVDLGLRASDVARLQLQDFHPAQRYLSVFSTKTGQRRQLPLTDRLAAAIARYVRESRPANASEQLFVRILPPFDRPLGSMIVRSAVRGAYVRCGFPASWTGTHRLRHTFATRLYNHGVALRQIGDLLGHRDPDSTNRYTHIDLNGLKALAQPWPR